MENSTYLPYRRVIVCGDRYATIINCGKTIKDFISSLHPDTIIIHGGCKGVDFIAGLYAAERNMMTIVFPAEWEKYGNAAGPIRNKLMLSQNPDLVIGFHSNIDQSKGTKHMIAIAEKNNVKTMVVTF